MSGGVSSTAYHHMSLMSATRERHTAWGICRRCDTIFIDLPRGNIAGVALGPLHDSREGDVAIDKQDSIGGAVVATGKVETTACSEAAQRAGIAQDIMSEGMIGKEGALKVIKDELGRVVAIAVYFLEYDTALLVNLMLREGAVKNDVGKELQGSCKIFLQEGRVDHRLLFIGKGIEVSSHVLHTIKDVPSTTFGGTLEEHVLYKMGKSCLMRSLVTCTHIDGIPAIDHRRR